MKEVNSRASTLCSGGQVSAMAALASVFLLILGCGGPGAEADARESLNAPVAELDLAGLASIGPGMQTLIDEGRVPGTVTAVVRRGELVHFDARGLADVENLVPMTGDTIFRWYSMTKPITCAALMLLVDEGKVRIDDPVAKFLPEFGAMQVRTADGLVPAATPITIRHLLTHTSGLTYGVLDSPVAADYRQAGVSGPENRLADRNLAEHVRALAALPLLAEPGSTWIYGESMGVLGRVIEAVSGQSFGEFLAERLFQPLAMEDTAFFVPSEKADRLAALYVGGVDGAIARSPVGVFGGDYLQAPRLEYGGAGLVGTAADYLRFAGMLLDRGKVGDVQILKPESVDLLLSDHLPADRPERPLASLRDINPWLGEPGLGFGFGGYVVVDPSRSDHHYSIGEYSWGGWARTNFWIDPEEELVGLILTQVIPGARPPETREILREAVYGARD